MTKGKVYFQGLNELRAIASLAVLLCHIESFKSKAGIGNIYSNEIISSLGFQGVCLFFVLSGFLISFLIHQEDKTSSQVSIKNFYIRRLLRIWPLYLLVLVTAILSVGITPFYFSSLGDSNLLLNLIMAIFIPNILLLIKKSYFMIGVLWSVGMEEQFYLVFPHFFKRFKKSFVFYSLITLSIIFASKLVLWIDYKKQITSFYEHSFIIMKAISFEPIIIGCILGSLFHKKSKLLSLFYHKVTQYSSLILLVLGFLIKPSFVALTEIIYAPLYAVIILNMATNPESIFTPIKNRYLDSIGKYSYGIYMLHSVIIALGIWLLKEELNSGYAQVLLYIFSIGGTILLAKLSYHLYEKKFLKLKHRFQ